MKTRGGTIKFPVASLEFPSAKTTLDICCILQSCSFFHVMSSCFFNRTVNHLPFPRNDVFLPPRSLCLSSTVDYIRVVTTVWGRALATVRHPTEQAMHHVLLSSIYPLFILLILWGLWSGGWSQSEIEIDKTLNGLWRLFRHYECDRKGAVCALYDLYCKSSLNGP